MGAVEFQFLLHFVSDDASGASRSIEKVLHDLPGLFHTLSFDVHVTMVDPSDGPLERGIFFRVEAYDHAERTNWERFAELLSYLFASRTFQPLKLQNVVLAKRSMEIVSPCASIYVDRHLDLPGQQSLHDALTRRFGPPHFPDGFFQYLIASDAAEEGVPVTPGEELAILGARVNDHPTGDGPQLGFKCQLKPGFRLTEFVAAMYGNLIPAHEAFGGQTILLTTLLQVNEKLEMINHVTERLENPENLTLYSLSALNMEMYNRLDPFHFCKLVNDGEIEIKDIVLGA